MDNEEGSFRLAGSAVLFPPPWNKPTPELWRAPLEKEASGSETFTTPSSTSADLEYHQTLDLYMCKNLPGRSRNNSHTSGVIGATCRRVLGDTIGSGASGIAFVPARECNTMCHSFRTPSTWASKACGGQTPHMGGCENYGPFFGP